MIKTHSFSESLQQSDANTIFISETLKYNNEHLKYYWERYLDLVGKKFVCVYRLSDQIYDVKCKDFAVAYKNTHRI